MKKFILIIAGLLVATATFAGTGYIANERIDAMLVGELDFTTLESADVTTTGDVTVGNDLTVAGDAAITGTLGVTGVATFTAESVHNLGIDADYITTDAAAGIDTKTAGALLVGAATATSVEIADTSVATDIQGTLSVDEAAVFDTTLDVVGALTAASFSGALDEQDIVYNSGAASACSYTGAITDIDSAYFAGAPLLALVVTDAVATATFNVAAAPGTSNMARPFTIVNTSTSVVTFGHNSLVYPAADITMGQYGTVTVSGLYTNMWVVTVDNTP